MAAASLIEQAQAGDAEAIASLLTQALAPNDITIVAERQSYYLVLELTGHPLPEQNFVVATIRQCLVRFQVDIIGIVQIHCALAGQPDINWREEFSLLGAVGHEEGAVSSGDVCRPLGTDSPAPSALDQAYRILNLRPEATLSEVDQAYFRLRAERLRQGKRDDVAALKAARSLLKESLQSVSVQSISAQSVSAPLPSPTAATDRTAAGLEALPKLLRSRGLVGKVRIKDGKLQIQLAPGSSQNPNRASATLYTLLEQADLKALGLDQLAQVEVYGLVSSTQIGWKRLVPLPPPATPDDTDLMSFQNRYVSALAFPALLLLGMGMNAMPLVNGLLFGIKIWFHEFGHATVAWMAGRRAIPLPIGWTNVGQARSLFVYVGVLTLLGLLFWAGRREGQRWSQILAGVLVVLQFCCTWLLPEPRFQTWLAFGGIGGELYLCTLLMVSFFFPLPAYWRWDFYRYPVVIGAAFTFWGQIWLWRQINRGVESIPWGSLWGGEANGDMNALSYAGWSDRQIIATYTTMSNVCLLALVSVYLYIAIRQNRHYLFALTQRWLARE
ncbi:MAG: hypothetical protein ACFB0G_04455 [Leptolyngbyaceae cyanobacterium]